MGNEKGVCVVCGEAARGKPAIADFAIGFMRRARKTLGAKPVHTVCCEKCMPECKKRRVGFESAKRTYLVLAALLFFGIVGSGAYLGADNMGLVVVAVVGALVFALTPYLRYAPRFSQD